MSSQLRFKIVVEYMSGDSFGSSLESDEIPYEWSNLSECQKALDIILETTKSRSDFTIMLPLDDGSMHQFSNFWNAGYFESLHSLEIKLVGVGEKIYV
ncbi:hypothetical protein [Proteus phage PM135]|uniref:Uncharacterized protein n=1 Tax=Proteus phage PM135 TaxID=2048008 RepID=A0A2H4PRL4_9CAUD|nr:hypothetical protein FDJ15_gp069 [Proteus phage PM135]ATW69952.1 hypothetical protein [Proteus phage PM135]UXY92252.1 hypothetical protein [Proteus phage RP7]